MAPQKNASLQQNPSRYNIIAGILFAVLALNQSCLFLRQFITGELTFNLLDTLCYIFWVIGIVVITVGLFAKKKGFLAVGFVFLILSSLFYIIILNSFGFFIWLDLLIFVGYLCGFLLSLAHSSAIRKGSLFIPALLTLTVLSSLFSVLRGTFPFFIFIWLDDELKYILEYILQGLSFTVAILFALLWLVSPISTNVNPHTNNVKGGIEMSKKFCSHCGSEIFSQAVVCPNCGCAVETGEPDVPNTGLNILALLFPIVGLILYLVYHDKTPNKANKIGQFALIGFCIGLFSTFILFAL